MRRLVRLTSSMPWLMIPLRVTRRRENGVISDAVVPFAFVRVARDVVNPCRSASFRPNVSFRYKSHRAKLTLCTVNGDGGGGGAFSRGKSWRSDKNRGLKSGQVSLSGCLIVAAFDLTRITRANASLNCIISRVLPASVFSQPFTGHEWISAIPRSPRCLNVKT